MIEPGKGKDKDSRHLTRPVRVGDSIVELPLGITAGEWLRYRSQVQNPRLRAFLGCINLLEEVLDSNYAILHSSAERFRETRLKVQTVSELIRADLAPLLESESPIPSLEATRATAKEAVEMLVEGPLRELDGHSKYRPDDAGARERQLLCVCIGKIHSFLQDTFGEFMAADPRSRHDADYFLSRRFQWQVEESEWLYKSVFDFNEYLKNLGQVGPSKLSTLIASMDRERMLPVGDVWSDAADFVNEVAEVLTPKIRQLLTLRGIRFPEMDALSGYADELPLTCSLLIGTYEAGRSVVDLVKSSGGRSQGGREQRVIDLIACHEANCRRLVRLAAKLRQAHEDLRFFIPIWLEDIEKRRALMLHVPVDDDSLVRERVREARDLSGSGPRPPRAQRLGLLHFRPDRWSQKKG